MQKFFFTSLLGILSPFLLHAGTADQPAKAQNQKFAEQVATDYQKGLYRSFLKQSHDAYQKAKKNWEHDILLGERKMRSEAVRSSIEIQGPTEKQGKKKVLLKKQRNRELLEIALMNPVDLMGQEVKEMVLFTPTKEEQEAIQYMTQLKNKFKGEGTSPIENQLIAIDIEFWLKTLENEALLSLGTIDYEAFRKQHLVLELEKVKQMCASCEDLEIDPQIKTKIDKAAEVWLRSEATKLTESYLKALAQEKVIPANGCEQALKAVMMKYQ